MIPDTLLDALLDTLKAVPFLYLAFLLMEFCEHRQQSRLAKWLAASRFWGPVVGALVGLLPQCGFSIAAANLYAGGLLTLGTLLSVLLATSDEALLLLLGAPGHLAAAGQLIACKLVISIGFGLLVDLILQKHRNTSDMDELCAECGCHEGGSLWMAALRHTVKTALFLLLFSALLEVGMTLIGQDRFAGWMLAGSSLQPCLSTLLGLIPSCASSILLSELYLAGTLSFPALLAGLCANSGSALLVLLRANPSRRENALVAGLLIGASLLAGFVVQLLPLF